MGSLAEASWRAEVGRKASLPQLACKDWDDEEEVRRAGGGGRDRVGGGGVWSTD